MKMSKKARSMAAVLTVMALTAGVSGVIMAKHIPVKGDTHPFNYVDSKDVATSLTSETLTVKDVIIDGQKVSDALDATKGIGDLKDQVKDLQDTTTKQKNAIENMDGRLTAQESMMGDVRSDVADLDEQVGKNTTDIAGLQDTAAEQGTAIENMDGRLTAQESMMGDVRSDVADLDEKIDGFDTQIGATGENGTLNLSNGATTVEAGINQNTSSLNTISSQIGATGENGTLNLSNGAKTIESGINQNYALIQQNTNAINSLDSRVDDLGGEIDQVGAISAALAGLHPLDYDGTGSKFQLSAAMGSYDSSQAAAIGAFYHFNRDVMISLGGATSFDGDHKTAGNLGVTFRIGEGASGKHVSDDVMARLEAMDQKIAALEQENKDLKNVLGTIDTSLSKEFPDVPANHWAYEAVTKLAGNDVVAGYPDGEFHGDRTMTRYEMAEVIYKAMQKGAKVDQKLVNEFKPEMEQVAANQNA